MDTLDRQTLEDLQVRILDAVDLVVKEAEQTSQPLEIDPARGRLFELFAAAEAAGCLVEGAEVDLSAEELCRLLGQRWGLQDAARQSVEQQAQLPASHLDQMRSLWSVMRMWMEWTYAWQRWDEFHRAPRQPR